MTILEYDRVAAVEYARKWAFGRNPAYFDFSRLGGDCTNFVSQCLYAGAKVMNDTPDVGWYYRSIDDRAAAWTGVEYFYNFLTGNLGEFGNGRVVGSGNGPFAEEVSLGELQIGDFIQLGRDTGDFYHTPIVVGFSYGVPLVAAHSNDVFNRPLNSYHFERIRCLHVLGVRAP